MSLQQSQSPSHHYHPEELQIVPFKETSIITNPIPSKQPNNPPAHFICRADQGNHHSNNNKLAIATIAPSNFFNHIQNGLYWFREKETKRNYLEIYKNDKELQKYINMLSCTVNQKTATTLLALFLLSKYKSHYQT